MLPKNGPSVDMCEPTLMVQNFTPGTVDEEATGRFQGYGSPQQQCTSPLDASRAGTGKL
jgi:hypothetical protein